MPQFVIVLKNKKLRTYTLISWLILALNFFLLLYVGVTRTARFETLPFYAAGLLVLIYLFRFISQNENVENDSITLSFSLAIITWIVSGWYWAAVIVLLLFIFQEISRRKLVVLVYNDRIVYPSFPKRAIEWQEMNNMVLKDGVLTIDLRNDKVFQDEIISPTSEIDFNEFCETRIQGLKN